ININIIILQYTTISFFSHIMNHLNGTKGQRDKGTKYCSFVCLFAPMIFSVPLYFIDFFGPAEMAEMAEMGFAQPCGMIIYRH
ncbi:MAG: hypothetical protein J6T43_11765, partial [Prevotella sp.]|nr:hypothetical protein [Prevotella sp.]